MKDLKVVLESILFVASKPVSLKELAGLSASMITDVQKCLVELTAEYKERGIRIIRKGEYFHFVSAPENAKIIAKYLNEELRHDLSQAALEALAIVTYKQPITRMEIEEIRGVNSDAIVRNLMIRGLITEVGRKEAIGRPILYGTTMEFLEFLGIEDEKEIPTLEEELLGIDESTLIQE